MDKKQKNRKPGKQASITLTMPATMKAILVKLAKTTNTSQSEVLRRALSIFDLIVTTVEKEDDLKTRLQTQNQIDGIKYSQYPDYSKFLKTV